MKMNKWKLAGIILLASVLFIVGIKVVGNTLPVFLILGLMACTTLPDLYKVIVKKS